MVRTSPCSKSKKGQTRGPYWTAQEDKILKDYIESNGTGRWSIIPKQAGLKRGGKSCRLRWMNYLRPDIKRGNISPDEEDLIIRLHKLLGNRWSLIAGRLPGRTDNEIKNYWNTILSKRVEANCDPPKRLSNREDVSINIKEPSDVDDSVHYLPPSVLDENVEDKNLTEPSINDGVLEKNMKEADCGFSDDSSWDLMIGVNRKQIINLSEILPSDDLDKLFDRNATMIENEDHCHIGHRNWSSPSSFSAESISVINWIGEDSFQFESDLDLW